MRSIFLILLLVLPKIMFGEIIYFPDAAFKYKLTHITYPNYQNFDSNLDGEIDTTEALAITNLTIQNTTAIHDLTGIQYFTNLVNLNFSFCRVAQADLHGLTQLKYVRCDYNYNLFTSLNLSGCSALELLNAHSNPFQNLDLSGCTALKTIDIHYSSVPVLDLRAAINLESIIIEYGRINSVLLDVHPLLKTFKASRNLSLTDLDFSAIPSLETIYVDYCSLQNLKVAQGGNLKNLRCQNNAISELNVSELPNLINIECSYNRISELDFRNSLLVRGFNCSHNELTSLLVNKSSPYTSIDCSYNKLTQLDVANFGNSFTNLNCSNNLLTDIQLHGNNLLSLDCSYNRFRTLDLSWLQNLSSLKAQGNYALTYLNLTYNDITPIQQYKLNLTENPNLHFVCVDSFREDFYRAYFASISRRNIRVSSDCGYKTEIYPNPATTDLHLFAMDDMITIKIFDMQGKLVDCRYPNYNIADISIANLATGIYVVEIKTLYATTTHKLYKI
ncbi:MAG: hypothetical protein RIT03_570 [Bacteroidota bacterium]